MSIMVCKAFDKRLDDAWYRLQRYEQSLFNGSISQISLDECCVSRIERMVVQLESAESARDERIAIEERKSHDSR